MPGRDDALRVAEQLCARITHDFSGSVGVLHNLLELAFERPDRAAEPLALANETAAQLVRRLKLVRAAWGPTSEPMPLDRLHDLALGLAQSRCVVNLDGLPRNTEFPAAVARVVLNLLLLAAESLPAGGEIGLTGTNEDLVLAISGQRATWPAGLAGCITDPDIAWHALAEPRTVQLALTVLLARQFGLHLSRLLGATPSATAPLRLRAR